MNYIPPQYAGDPYAVQPQPQQVALRPQNLEVQRQVAEMNQPLVSQVSSVGDGGGYGLLSKEYQAKRDEAEALRKVYGESRADYATRVGATTQRRGQDLTNSATLRGQDLTYGATTRGQDVQMRGQDLTNASTLRGQDMDLQGRLIPKQMEIQMTMAKRAMMQDVLKGATDKDGNVDYTKAQQLALQTGIPDIGEAFAKTVGNIQGQTDKANDIRDKGTEQFRKMFAGRATHLDKDGTPESVKALEDRMANDYLAANPGIVNAPRTEQVGAATRAAAEFGLRQRINNLDEGGWAAWGPTKMLGLQREIKPFESLPDPSWWAGAKLSDTVGGIRGALSPNLEKGDQYVTLRDGSTLNLGRMSAEELALVDNLIKQGSSLRKTK